MKRKFTQFILVRTIVFLIDLVLLCPAAFSSLSESIYIEVSGGENGQQTGSAIIYPEIDLDELMANPQQTFTWHLEQPLEIAAESNPDNVLATVQDITVEIKGDPKVNLGFSAAAGQYETYFSFTSEVLSFETISNPDAYAWASATTLPGDTLTGNYEYGEKSYEAMYNGSEVFAHLVDNVTGGTSTEDKGWQSISGDVSSIQSKWWFHLSPYGSASGSSTFEVTPEPATITLLGLGMLIFLRRRK